MTKEIKAAPISGCSKDTDNVSGRAKPSKAVLIASYLGIWAFVILIFWFFIDGSDAFGYSLVFLWIILPASTLVTSLLIGKNDYQDKLKWVAPVAFGLMHMLAEYATFSLRNMLAISFSRINAPDFGMLLIGVFSSVIGLVLGSIFRHIKNK